MKQNNTNKTFKTELEKLKQMSIEDRLWYIWEYYKLQIFAFFLVIFLLYEAGACIYRNLQDTMLYCVTVNETSLLSSDFSVVQKEFEEKNGFDKTWKQNTIFDCSLSIDDSYLSSKLPLSDGSSLSVCTDKNHPDVIQDFIKYCLWGN